MGYGVTELGTTEHAPRDAASFSSYLSAYIINIKFMLGNPGRQRIEELYQIIFLYHMIMLRSVQRG